MNKKIKILIGVFIVIIIIGGGFIFYKAQDNTIKIGVVGTMTVNGAYFGQQELRGAELAKDEINAKGGINGKKVEFIVEDSQAQPAKAISAVQKLINVDKVKYIVGDSWNSTVVPMLPIINENKVILISPFAGLNQLSQNDYFFRTVPSTKDMMDKLADYTYNKMGSRNVAILQAKNPFGEEHTKYFTEAFEKLGGKISKVEGVELTQDDVRSELTKLKLTNPDTILNVHTAGPKMGMAIKQAKELGIKSKWIGQFGIENAAIKQDYKSIADGIVYPYSFDVNDNQPSVKKFVSLYQEKYKEMPDFVAANSYDAVMVLAKTIEASGNNTEKAKSFIENIKDFEGASGLFSFDQNGDVKKDIILKTFVNGEFTKLK